MCNYLPCFTIVALYAVTESDPLCFLSCHSLDDKVLVFHSMHALVACVSAVLVENFSS